MLNSLERSKTEKKKKKGGEALHILVLSGFIWCVFKNNTAGIGAL